MDISANPHETHVDQPEVVRCSVVVHRQPGGSTKGLSTERLCTGREVRCTLLPFHPLLGYPALETESGRWQAHITQQTTIRINKPINTHVIPVNASVTNMSKQHYEQTWYCVNICARTEYLFFVNIYIFNVSTKLLYCCKWYDTVVLRPRPTI